MMKLGFITVTALVCLLVVVGIVPVIKENWQEGDTQEAIIGVITGLILITIILMLASALL